MTAEREKLLQKIKRVQALAERGEGGEKENAAALLERMMKQYGISESDIAEEHREIAWFRYKTPLERKLLVQVIYTVTGRVCYGCVGTHTGRSRKQVGLECTAAERLEIEISFEFFNAALQTEIERFYSAFLIKNNIFPPDGKAVDKAPDPEEMSEEEKWKLGLIMAGMDEHTRLAMLESGVQE